VERVNQCGARISPISGCASSCIWSQSWIGSAVRAELVAVAVDGDGLLPGALDRALRRGGRRSSTAIRDRSSPVRSSRQAGSEEDCREHGRRGAASTTFSSSGCGASLNTGGVLKDYESVAEARAALRLLPVLQLQRLHQSLDYRTPAAVYLGEREPMARRPSLFALLPSLSSALSGRPGRVKGSLRRAKPPPLTPPSLQNKILLRRSEGRAARLKRRLRKAATSTAAANSTRRLRPA